MSVLSSAAAAPLQTTPNPDPVPDSLNELLVQYGGLVGGIIKFVVAFFVVWFLARLVLVPIAKRLMEGAGYDETVLSLADSLLGALAVVLAIAIAFTVAGFGQVIAAFATLAGALALALGFAAQDLLSNFVAGVFILKDKPFEVGDWIEWNDMSGRVEDIDLRVSRVKTFDNERITVPNSELADNAVKNPVAYDKLRQKFVFGIGYDDDIDHARSVIVEEAETNPDILDDPAPDVRVTELADSYVGLQSRFWISDPGRSDFVRIRSDFVQAVKERLDAETIDMPYPYRQLTGAVETTVTDSESRSTVTDD
ncbi:mechanosensitive ion channel family protein [Halogeometricum sp. S1BR25-6]|uniref:Mechanosensitive ion channel family protein n=1 Tax=Halogeometricum salsisoli TaxID=2950536 RepID=A0ABU2G8Z5_9EURY|nr:mechanosensitive ion channel family protein [Halogeometricum sp. S1BR25-6]MDS0297280.1 mechanosensitive ion channel family protein [Halogeometricum sp. S1BR25-6]